MNKKVFGVVGLAVLAVGTCGSLDYYSYDGARFLQESREGRTLLTLNRKEEEKINKVKYEESNKVMRLRAEIEEAAKSGKLTKNAMQEKYEELESCQRSAKFAIENAEYESQKVIRRRSGKFVEKADKFVEEYASSKKVALINRAKASGVIFLPKTHDKTEELLKAFNENYDKEKAKMAFTKPEKKQA